MGTRHRAEEIVANLRQAEVLCAAKTAQSPSQTSVAEDPRPSD